MRLIVAGCVAAMLALFASSTLACGGGYGNGVTIRPSQTIAVTHRNGEQVYVFQPHFCGNSSDFGLILPVPSPLTRNPTLGESQLLAQLDAMTAPRIETVDVCAGFGFLGAMDKSGAEGAGIGYAVDDDGVDVVAAGTVGIFSWELLRADTSQNFTDWLDARRFAYPSSARAAFEHYVQAGWYFVAFQVTASNSSVSEGVRICGDFGPIALAFTTEQPVIPARIAVATESYDTFYWRVIAIAAHELHVSNTGAVQADEAPEVSFAGELTETQLGQYPAVAGVSNAGEWITRLNLVFRSDSLEDDVRLTPTNVNLPFRQVIYVAREVDCGVFGCSAAVGYVPSRRWWGLVVAFGVPSVFVAGRRRRAQRFRH